MENILLYLALLQHAVSNVSIHPPASFGAPPPPPPPPAAPVAPPAPAASAAKPAAPKKPAPANAGPISIDALKPAEQKQVHKKIQNLQEDLVKLESEYMPEIDQYIVDEDSEEAKKAIAKYIKKYNGHRDLLNGYEFPEKESLFKEINFAIKALENKRSEIESSQKTSAPIPEAASGSGIPTPPPAPAMPVAPPPPPAFIPGGMGLGNKLKSPLQQMQGQQAAPQAAAQPKKPAAPKPAGPALDLGALQGGAGKLKKATTQTTSARDFAKEVDVYLTKDKLSVADKAPARKLLEDLKVDIAASSNDADKQKKQDLYNKLDEKINPKTP